MERKWILKLSVEQLWGQFSVHTTRMKICSEFYQPLKIARIQSITLFLSLIQKGEHKLTEVLMLGECFEE